jgi:NAD(P)-dependent dehydrogenase (short-subunit alcohol dehydrogenase family)
VERTAAHWGAIHVLVNNAATVTPGNKIADLTLEQWRQALDVNLTGAWLMSRCAIPHMARAGSGVVLNIASQLGSVAAPGRGAYGASKAGLIALARAIAVDHAADGIRALSLSPGAVLTSRLVARYGSAQAAGAALAAKYPAGRLGTAEEIAQTAVFLISDAASFITGTDIRADGGYTAL